MRIGNPNLKNVRYGLSKSCYHSLVKIRYFLIKNSCKDITKLRLFTYQFFKGQS